MGRKSNGQSRTRLRHLENARKQREKVVAQKEAELKQGIRRTRSGKTYRTAAPPVPLIHIVSLAESHATIRIERLRKKPHTKNLYVSRQCNKLHAPRTVMDQPSRD